MPSDTLIVQGAQGAQTESAPAGVPASAPASETASPSPSATTQAGGVEQASTAQQAREGSTSSTASDPTQPQGAPERYEFQAPEGQPLDTAVVSAFSDVAKDLNLSQEAAQKVLDTMAPVIAARQVEQVEAARSAWAESAKFDKEFGGGALPESLAVAKKALDTFGSPELMGLLNASGLGNHPEVIRVFWRAGKALGEDTFVGGQAAPATTTDARALYPNSKLN